MNEKASARPVSVDDLQSLYSELRGSRSAPAIMDARAHFLERQWSDAHAKLREAYESYCESRQRILRKEADQQVDAKSQDRDRQVRRVQRKQDKAREIIECFESMLPQLERLAEKERSKQSAAIEAQVTPPAIAPETGSPTPDDSQQSDSDDSAPDAIQVIKPAAIHQELLQYFSDLIGDRQIEFVTSLFDFKPLTEIDDVRSDAVYLLRKKDRCLLICAQTISGDTENLLCVDLRNAKNNVELSRQAMVRLSEQRKLVLLLEKPE